MMSGINLGRLQKVSLRDVWFSEAGEFTPWLAQSQNLQMLGYTIGIELECEAQEKSVGPFRADILCKDTATDSWVLVENQLEKTDHCHLGQLLTYAAGLEVVTVVWVAERFTEEHRAALDWLNERTDDKINFFGLEVELWRIGESQIAPKFNVVSKPNDWTKSVSETAKQIQGGAISETKQLQQEFWTEFRDYLHASGSFLQATKPAPRHWMFLPIGRSGFKLQATVDTVKRQLCARLIIDDERAKDFFQSLLKQKDEIEGEAHMAFVWREMPDRKQSRIGIYLENIDPSDRKRWSEFHEWMRQKLEMLHRVFAKRVKSLVWESAEQIVGGE